MTELSPEKSPAVAGSTFPGTNKHQEVVDMTREDDKDMDESIKSISANRFLHMCS